MKILQVDNLVTEFETAKGKLRAVDQVSFSLSPGEILGLVGESGSGKTVTALSILKLIQSPGKITQGRILFSNALPPSMPPRPFVSQAGYEYPSHFLDQAEAYRSRSLQKNTNPLDFPSKLQFPWGEPDYEKEGWAIDLLKQSDAELQKIRGNQIAMIFQEPMTSLNPIFTIGDQIAEGLILHRHLSSTQALKQAAELLTQVGIADAEKRLKDYPHQLSGGMRQRVMIAMALACDPKILIADEPTTALDVTIQAQILQLIKKIVKEQNRSMILITHDLGVVAQVCDRVAVMYAGKMVEQAPADLLFSRPKHPYTQGLLKSIPSFQKSHEPLKTIPGSVPSLTDLPTGCRFHPRCPRASKACEGRIPRMKYVGSKQWVRCFNT